MALLTDSKIIDVSPSAKATVKVMDFLMSTSKTLYEIREMRTTGNGERARQTCKDES